MDKIAISVIIVSFNTKDVLKSCIESLQKVAVPLEIFIVDNNSKDGTRNMLRDNFSGWPALKVLYNERNIGFTRASNQALYLSSGKYILFLNPDTIVKAGALEELVAFLDNHPDIGVIGPKLVYSDGTLQVSCGDSWGLSYIILWHFLPARISHFVFQRHLIKWTGYEQKDVRWILGACLMIRRELALKLQGFDENFFLSADDAADLCLRVIQKGYRVVYYPKVTVIHVGGESYRQARGVALLNAYRGHVYFVKKHFGVVQAFILRFALSSFSAVKGLCAFAVGTFSLNRHYRLLGKVHLTVAFKMFTPSFLKTG